MNTQQAKFILQGYRPNGADAGDATFAPALEQARHDQVLSEWFAREQGFDRIISAKLGEVRPPAGLREAILAGARLTEAENPAKNWWRNPVWLAVAASMAVLFAVSLAFWPKAAVADNALVNFVVADARHPERHGGRGEETKALRVLLDEPTTRLSRGLATDVAALSASGCRTLHFNGRDLIEVCFQRNGAWFHCYIGRRADFSSLAMAVDPTLTEQGGMTTAAWADAGHLYVVVSETGRAALEKLL